MPLLLKPCISEMFSVMCILAITRLPLTCERMFFIFAFSVPLLGVLFIEATQLENVIKSLMVHFKLGTYVLLVFR